MLMERVGSVRYLDWYSGILRSMMGRIQNRDHKASQYTNTLRVAPLLTKHVCGRQARSCTRSHWDAPCTALGGEALANHSIEVFECSEC